MGTEKGREKTKRLELYVTANTEKELYSDT